MQPRLCLLCRWTLHSMPAKGFKEDLTIIVPRSVVNTPDNISSDVYAHWSMKYIGEPVKSWLLESFNWVESGHPQQAMYYGLSAPRLPDGRTLLTLPVLITTFKHQLEFVFCGYCVKPGDSIHSGYGIRTFLPQHEWFDSTIKECFAGRTLDNSLYVDYTTKYSIEAGVAPWDARVKDAANV